MSDLKTTPNDRSVTAFLKRVADPQKRADCFALVELMHQATGEAPRMWGASIVGFGQYHYRYASGREGDWFLTGFAPRKQNLTLYIMSGFDGYEELLARLGQHKTGKSCLYLKRLADVNSKALKDLLTRSVAHLRRGNPAQF